MCLLDALVVNVHRPVLDSTGKVSAHTRPQDQSVTAQLQAKIVQGEEAGAGTH